MSSDHQKEPGTIELPTPTAWPIISAFGLTLFFAGLVTDISITIVGTVVGLVGAVYWCLDLFPHPKHEPVKIRLAEDGPKPIRTAGRVVQMLEAGHVPHRAHIPVAVHPYTAGVIGGAAGGVAMAIAACIAGQILFGSIWYPVNLLAAGGLPSLATAGKQTLMDFNAAGLIVGILSHGTVSIMVGLLYTVIVPMLPRRFEWLFAGIVIPIIWTALIFFTLGLINPALNSAISWPAFVVCQIIFGLVCGFIVFRSGKVETMQSWSLAQKLGVEAQHRAEEEKNS
jgi:hypothetical protein